MLVNIIQNTISSFRSALAAAEVITTNLKMWLGFETSETLGTEEVVNGDFATDLSNWSIANSDSTHTVIHTSNGARFQADTSDATFTFTSGTANIVSGRRYQIKVVISEYQGSNGIKIQSSATGNVNYLFDSVDTFTYSFTAVSNSSNPIQFYRNGANVDITIKSVSLKELTQFTPDKSGNNNVGELFTGKALYFDGAGYYVDISGFSMSGNNATFAFWAYIDSNITGEYFFDFHSSTTRFVFGFGQANQELALYSGGWAFFGDPPQDQWVRIVLTVKGTTAKCFVDDVQLGDDKTISTYDFSSPTTARIGSRYIPFPSPKYYNGLLSDFQVYNKAWLNEDIAYDYANPQNLVTDRDNTTIALSNLKAYWAMSEGAGSLTYDSSGEGNNGTIYGATYEPAQPRIPQLGMMNWSKPTIGSNVVTLIPNPNNTSQDILGNAIRDRLNSFNLDGTGYAEVADDADLDFGTGDFTLECWLRIDGNTDRRLLDKRNTTSGYTLYLTKSNVLKLELNDGTGNTGFDLTSSLNSNTWLHLAIVCDRSANATCYVNKAAQTPVSISSKNGNIDSTSNLIIGADAPDGLSLFSTDIISDVRLYDRALSSTEVENNYNAGLSAHTN
jgi:hypothetical protein